MKYSDQEYLLNAKNVNAAASKIEVTKYPQKYFGINFKLNNNSSNLGVGLRNIKHLYEIFIGIVLLISVASCSNDDDRAVEK